MWVRLPPDPPPEKDDLKKIVLCDTAGAGDRDAHIIGHGFDGRRAFHVGAGLVACRRGTMGEL